MALPTIQTEPIVLHLGELFAVSQRIADLHLRPRSAVLALHANEVRMLAVPLGRGAVASVLVVHVLAAQVLELDAFASMEAGKAGMLWAANFILVFACNACVSLRLQVTSVHIARALTMLSVNVRLSEEGDGVCKGTEQVAVVRRT